MADENKDVVKEVPTGMVEFTFEKDHGTRKKGEKLSPMHKSTADALIAHKIGKITKVLKVVKKETVEQ